MASDPFRPQRERFVSQDSSLASPNSGAGIHHQHGTAVMDPADLLEERILDRVSKITISSTSWTSSADQSEHTAEVSFTEEETTTQASSVSPVQLLVPCSTSPLRTTGKRKVEQHQTPVRPLDCATPRVCNVHLPRGPRRKKRRPGSLTSAPRLPDSPPLNNSASPLLQSVYDRRLERMVGHSPNLSPIEIRSRRIGANRRRKLKLRRKRAFPHFPPFEPPVLSNPPMMPDEHDSPLSEPSSSQSSSEDPFTSLALALGNPQSACYSPIQSPSKRKTA